MKFRKISASVLAISLILTVNAAAYDSAPESNSAEKSALQTSYDRSELTPTEERAIIEQWLEEYPNAVVGTSNGMLVLDTRPWSDSSTESAPACIPDFSMEEYLAEYPTVGTSEANTEKENIFSSMTPDEIDSFVQEHLVYDTAINDNLLQTTYDRSDLTNEEERAIIEQWLEEYPDAIIGTSNGMLTLDTRPWSDFSTESAPACMPDFPISNSTTETNTVNPRTIIDGDNRRHCLTTSVAPFSFTAYTISLFDKGDNTYVPASGTAFFVDKDLLLTAGHCVYHPDYGYAEKIYIFPGGCESGISYSVSYTAYASNKWVSDAEDKNFHDYGVIKVLVDISYGYYALSEKTESQLSSKNITLYGFPLDKPYSGTKPVSGIGDFYEFWISTGTIDATSIQDNYFLHVADTETGNSGSPVFLSDSIGTVVGINTAHLDGLPYNVAIRITSSIIQFVNRYK